MLVARHRGRVLPDSLATSRDCFHRSIRPTLYLAQLFGLLPVQGLSAPTSDHLKFTWVSIYTITALFTLAGAFFMVALSVIRFANKQRLSSATRLVFFGTSFMSACLFLRLAMFWPHLARSWQHCELHTSHHGYPPRLATKVLVFTLAYALFASAEHCLAFINGLLRAQEKCFSGTASLQELCLIWFPQVFYWFSYTVPIGTCIIVLNTFATFNFSYLDLFIVVISYCLAEKFKQFNNYLIGVKEKDLPRAFWQNMHKDYMLLCELARTIDAHVSRIVMLAFVSNTFHICLQLYYSLKPPSGLFGRFYFVFSFTFLALRTCLVCVSGSRVHEQSTRGKHVLFSVPSASYCQETELLLEEMRTANIALTGMEFFQIKRTLLVTVCGLALSYVTMMFQFKSLATEDESEAVQVIKHGI